MGKIPLSIYIDLSKTFDTLNFEILLDKLAYYGIKDIANSLIRIYLTNRKQIVEYAGLCRSPNYTVQVLRLLPIIVIYHTNIMYVKKIGSRAFHIY